MGKKYRIISLFSGCGGLDLGFRGGFESGGKLYRAHPSEMVFANDIMPEACESIKLNFPDVPVHCGDIKELLDGKPEAIPSADIVTGGFPCQDFSLAGKRSGFESDRGKLYLQMKRVIELVKPAMFVAENVKGLTNLGTALEIISKDFAETQPEYEVSSKLLLAADYGVPQSRERVFIVGIRKDMLRAGSDSFGFPEPTHSNSGSENRERWVSAKQAISDLDGSYIDRQDQYSGAKNYGAHLQGNRAINPDKPAPTIRAEHHGNIEFHYDGHRRLSVRECARIQSFPDEYRFYGSMSKAYVQIGNAVPPVLGWHIAESVFDMLNRLESKHSSDSPR